MAVLAVRAERVDLQPVPLLFIRGPVAVRVHALAHAAQERTKSRMFIGKWPRLQFMVTGLAVLRDLSQSTAVVGDSPEERARQVHTVEDGSIQRMMLGGGLA